ncbi:glycerol-3-phosphate dehydrogenase C-terminal domain-containing protein, partial [Stutzerimonas nitrititolerans]
LARRWASLYGSRVWRMLGEARAVNELGELIGQGLYTREVDYLRRQEWATRPDDILWRRTKLGLVFTDQETARLQHYLAMTKAKEQAA